MPETPQEHALELPEDPRAVLRQVARAADDWGGIWQVRGPDRGRLGLPVEAGVRRGWVAGEVEVEGVGEGSCRLRFRVEESEYRVDQATVAVLVLAACGALVTVFLPFFPRLIRLVPVAILLALGAWLFIVSRLRNSGPEDFLQDLAERSAAVAKSRV